ncbi:hypothetical protein [Streptomyces odontomachi]|uniref:hypothetical protein n=1 Tax=Streptomyces odontomachi TaxID=2944940 RepID=UPI00210BA4FE|nr:hypothetical protein [Streptomyces sp. ODS25]
MAAIRTRTCDGECARSLPFDELTPVSDAPGHYLCDACAETSPYLLDHLTPDRWPPSDDSGPTPPVDAPGPPP